MKKISLGMLLSGAVIFGAAIMSGADTHAVSMTINPGDDVWAAVNQMAEGDTLTFNAGTYTLDNYIDINGQKGLTFVGVGEVILEYDGAGGLGVPGIKQAIQIYNSQNIKVSNFIINAIDNVNEATWATASTGVGVNSSCGVELDDLKISGFGKSAVTVTAYQDGSETCASGNITLNNIDAEGDGYGIMFTNGSAAPATDITGVVFGGTTKLAGVAAGVVTDGDYDGAVTGENGGQLSLGVVDITTSSGQYAIAMNASSPAVVSDASVVDGKKISEMTDTEREALLGTNVMVQADEVPVAPLVPATGAMTEGDEKTANADIIALAVSLLMTAAGAGVAIRRLRR